MKIYIVFDIRSLKKALKTKLEKRIFIPDKKRKSHKPAERILQLDHKEN